MSRRCESTAAAPFKKQKPVRLHVYIPVIRSFKIKMSQASALRLSEPRQKRAFLVSRVLQERWNLSGCFSSLLAVSLVSIHGIRQHASPGKGDNVP